MDCNVEQVEQEVSRVLVRSNWRPSGLYKIISASGLPVAGVKQYGPRVCLLTFYRVITPQALDMVQRVINPEYAEEETVSSDIVPKTPHKKDKSLHMCKLPRNLLKR